MWIADFYLKKMLVRGEIRRSQSDGFTLIELMIVVGIIGILVSVAGPMYGRYQRKARQAEAKIQLGSVYSLEKSFNAEYAAYIGCFDSIGYEPEGARRFYAIALSNNGVPGATVTGFAGARTIAAYDTLNTPYTIAGGEPGHSCTNIMGGTDYVNDSQVFVAYAGGNLGISYDDIWTINQLKILRNCSKGF